RAFAIWCFAPAACKAPPAWVVSCRSRRHLLPLRRRAASKTRLLIDAARGSDLARGGSGAGAVGSTWSAFPL
ncbi:unnamed protein product, partial [Amoebophrya sp. A120]